MENMPLLREYTNYGAWETEAKRRPTMLYNITIIWGADGFVNNSKDRKAAKIDVESGGFVKHKVSPEIEDNEKANLRGEPYEPIDYY